MKNTKSNLLTAKWSQIEHCWNRARQILFALMIDPSKPGQQRLDERSLSGSGLWTTFAMFECDSGASGYFTFERELSRPNFASGFEASYSQNLSLLWDIRLLSNFSKKYTINSVKIYWIKVVLLINRSPYGFSILTVPMRILTCKISAALSLGT